MKENHKLDPKDGQQIIVPSNTKKGFYEVRSFFSNGKKSLGIATKEELEKHFLMGFKQYNHVDRKEVEDQATYQFLNRSGESHKSGVCNIQITLSKEDTGLNKEESLDYTLMHAKVQNKLYRRGVTIRNIVLGVTVFAIMETGLYFAVRQGLKTRFGDEFFQKPSTSQGSEMKEETPKKEQLSEEELIRQQIYDDIMNQMEEENNIGYNK